MLNWRVGFFCLSLAAFSTACNKGGGGCTDPYAVNYNPQAQFNDGSCYYGNPSPNPGYYSWGSSFTGNLATAFSEDWDNWSFTLDGISGSVKTAFSNDWDNWSFNIGGLTGSLQTAFSEDWDNWDLNSGNYHLSLRTAFSEDWDNWDIDDDNGPWHADVKTTFSEDWDNWEANGDSLDFDLDTYFSEDWDHWSISGQIGDDVPIEFQLAVSFVPVMVNVLRQQSIIP